MVSLLAGLVGFGTYWVLTHARFDATEVEFSNQRHAQQVGVWRDLAAFFQHPRHCTSFLQGHKLGESLIGSEKGHPIIGQEWNKSGWVVKELYLLRRQDEVAWQVNDSELLRPRAEQLVYLKVGVVPKPQGKITVDYLLSSRPSYRIFPIPVALGEVRTFAGCDSRLNEIACQSVGLSLGATAKLAVSRAPASVSKRCQGGRWHQALCVLQADHLPIRRCEGI